MLASAEAIPTIGNRPPQPTMSFDLNELRAQRERIRAHLAWLDSQIAQAEGKPATEESTAETAVATAETAVEATVIPPHTTSDPQIADLPEFVPDKAPNSKFGCFAIATAIGLLAIFLLFGLPYLLPLSEFEQANADLVEAYEAELISLPNQAVANEFSGRLLQEIMRQKQLMRVYRENKESLTDEAQSTLRTINALEDIQEELRNIALDAPPASSNSAE